MAPSRLEVLASQISEHREVVNEYLVANSKKLSFDVDGEPTFPNDAPETILTSRRLVREATKELGDLMTGPSEHLRWFPCGVTYKAID
jgi:6-hydroxytryprostatin B O-methyltransferase